ncbi:MAG: hypothetical protein IPP61_09745 [Cytophagaceae bacterium]|nr:hypothetical protein [Cytophagaceae bacterium]MBL0302623.1 hypothetical protein [Cytophagaceae bacterium]MBL0325447.1 hypothetical protein [Cytophagaceae bacterium]
MSEDLFNKKIKEKFEDYTPPVRDDVWDKLKNNTPKPVFWTWWHQYALPLYALLSTGAIIFLLSKNYFTKNTAQVAENQVSVASATIPDSIFIYKKDTVFIEKITYLNSEKKQNRDESANWKKLYLAVNEKLQSIENQINSNTIGKTQENETEKPKPQLASEIVGISDKNLAENKTKEPAKEEELKELILPDAPPKAKPDSIINQKKQFHWPYTRFGIAQEADLLGGLSIGAMIETFLFKNLSVGVGGLVTRYKEVEYENPRDFNLSTGKVFEELFASGLPATYDQISDIKIKTTFFELPVGVNLYFPLHKNLKLKMYYGSHFDIKTFQSVKVETYKDEEETYTVFQNQREKSGFHNLVFGTGIQYQKNRFSLQITPTYIYNFKEVDYLKTGGKFRLNTQLYYRIK